jgi:hypothetical protein
VTGEVPERRAGHDSSGGPPGVVRTTADMTGRTDVLVGGSINTAKFGGGVVQQ